MTEINLILFTDLRLAELKQSRPIDGVAAGTFFSFWGGEFTITPDDLQDFVKNTKKMLRSTKDSDGDIVGLPIDMESHNHMGGAGWIVNLEMDPDRDIILFYVNWTDQGKEVIRENLTRFFSPSLDLENKLVLGGSLTNWPASRDAAGNILLRPVELSQTIKEIDMDFTEIIKELKALPGNIAATVKEAVKPVELSQPPADPKTLAPTEKELVYVGNVSPAMKEFLKEHPEELESLGKQAAEIAEQRIRFEQRKQLVVDFASRMVGGTKEKPFGLKVSAKELASFTLRLPEEMQGEFMKLMENTLDRAVDFAIHGVDSEGFIQRPKLEGKIKEYALSWMKTDGATIEGFFRANPELGSVEDFDITEFKKQEAK